MNPRLPADWGQSIDDELVHFFPDGSISALCSDTVLRSRFAARHTPHSGFAVSPDAAACDCCRELVWDANQDDNQIAAGWDHSQTPGDELVHFFPDGSISARCGDTVLRSRFAASPDAPMCAQCRELLVGDMLADAEPQAGAPP